MDDVWGNAWSTAGSAGDTEVKKPIPSGAKWNAFERDADDDTVDVGVTSWNVGSGWGGAQSSIWHAESSTLDAWSSDMAQPVPDAEDDEPKAPNDEETDDEKDLEPRPILPTPPQSPLPILPSPPPVPSPAAEETLPSSPAPVRTVPGSPDPFGSFESAEAETPEANFQHAFPLTSKSPDLPAAATDEPWGGAWGRQDKDEVDKQNDEELKDEWELAQEARRRQERKVPPQLLASLVAQWDEYAKENYPGTESEDTGSQNWRKGLDNVEGLNDLVESLIPVASFPPTQFSKSAVSRAARESLRLSRSFAVTRSSPMAHLYASKGSTDWERSVKAQKAAANDEWGWDLKHEPEEKPDSTDSAKERKGSGLLSFWSKRASSGTPTGDSPPMKEPKSPTVAIKPTTPTTSTRPSIDVSPNASSSAVMSPGTVPAPATASPSIAADPAASEGNATQPSAVSRFFNRFSRKPSAPQTPSGQDNRSSLVLSGDDLSILSDMVPSVSGTSAASGSGNSSFLNNAHDSSGSLEAMLSSRGPGARSPGKLPPPLAPPPAAVRIAGPGSAKSTTSDSSFDAKMADVQLLDILENMGQRSSDPGYAPLSFDLIDSPEDANPQPSAVRSSPVRSPAQVSSSPPPRQQPSSQRSSWFASPNPTLHSTLPPPLPPPIAPPRPEARLSSVLAPATPPPPSPLRNSFNPQKYDPPLPPTPQRDVDDFSEFFSAPTPSPSKLLPVSSSSANQDFFSASMSQTLPVASTGTHNSVDLGDFGDFISHSPQYSPPPKAPQILSRAANHKPTLELVEKAASLTGRWPAPPSPLPQPLAPPPGNRFLSMSSKPPDLLSDDSPSKPRPASGVLAASVLPQPLFAGPPSRPASTSISGLAPSPPPTLTPRSATASPFNVASGQPPAKSGLSAQDLSFFEGL